MSDFVKTVELHGHTYTFCFHLVISPGGRKYFVTVQHSPGETTAFELKQHDNRGFKVILPAPPFVLELEETLSNILLREIASSDE